MKPLVIILMFFISCKSILSERHYNSTDEVTGGFNNFTLDLHTDGTLILKIETSVATDVNETGSNWEKKQKKIEGNWNIKDEKIEYSLKGSKSSIDSIFFDTDFYALIKNPILSFSAQLDTAYIYGIPCSMSNNK